VREHGSRLRLFLRAAARDATTVDELFQEALLVAWRRRGDFDPERCFGKWIRGIASRLVLARRRQDARRMPSLDAQMLEHLDELCATPAGRAATQTGDELQALRRCVAGLTDAQQEIIRLRYEEGHTGRKLAERVGRSVEATKKVLQRLRARLHDCIRTTLANPGATS
jgi:RNA polymerase sigma-70 factor (ECF subfamily)